MRAVADAGPIIHLSWIESLGLLPHLFEELVVPRAVEQEVTNARSDTPGIEAIRRALRDGWLRVRPVHNEATASRLRSLEGLGPGEAEAVVLFREAGADILLIDDRRARLYAQHHGLPVTGTIGILRRARDLDLISQVGPRLEELRSRGFRISNSLAQMIMEDEAH